MSLGSLRRAAFFGVMLLAAGSANAELLVDNGETGRPDVIFDDQPLLAAQSPDLLAKDLSALTAADKGSVWSLADGISGARGGELRPGPYVWAPLISAGDRVFMRPNAVVVPAPVPLPAALWLFVSGAAGLVTLRYVRTWRHLLARYPTAAQSARAAQLQGLLPKVFD